MLSTAFSLLSTFTTSVLLTFNVVMSPFLPSMIGSLVSFLTTTLPACTLHSCAPGQLEELVCQPSTTTVSPSGILASAATVWPGSSVLVPAPMCARWQAFCSLVALVDRVDVCFVSITVCFLSCRVMVPFTKSWVTWLSTMKGVPATKSACRLSTTSALKRTVQLFLWNVSSISPIAGSSVLPSPSLDIWLFGFIANPLLVTSFLVT